MSRPDHGRASDPYLVTGAAGFIGRRLALTFRAKGLAVRALVRPEHDVDDLVAAGIEVHRGDVRDPGGVTRAANGCRTILHLAAARGWKKLSQREFEAANREMTMAVALAALRSGRETRLVLTSTATLTGNHRPAPQTETTHPRPNSAYRKSRLADERLLEELGRSRGPDFVIVRVPQMVLGPGAHAWARWVRRVRDGRLRILPRGGTLHSGDVDDVVEGLRLAAVTEGVAGERFLLGAERPESIASVFSAIATSLGTEYRPRLVPAAPFLAYTALGDRCFRAFGVELPHHYTCEFLSTPFSLDIGRARTRLGFAPRFGILQSVERTVDWLVERGGLDR
jgi:nucleoside-diphosphate-sugar epimerase